MTKGRWNSDECQTQPVPAGFFLLNASMRYKTMYSWLHESEKPKNKKACYELNSRLSMPREGNLVGCAGVEPTTNGLKVRCSTN